MIHKTTYLYHPSKLPSNLNVLNKLSQFHYVAYSSNTCIHVHVHVLCMHFSEHTDL